MLGVYRLPFRKRHITHVTPSPSIPA
jgi:hypothetical protein